MNHETFGAEYLETPEETAYGRGTWSYCQWNSGTGVLWCQNRPVLPFL